MKKDSFKSCSVKNTVDVKISKNGKVAKKFPKTSRQVVKSKLEAVTMKKCELEYNSRVVNFNVKHAVPGPKVSGNDVYKVSAKSNPESVV